MKKKLTKKNTWVIATMSFINGLLLLLLLLLLVSNIGFGGIGSDTKDLLRMTSDPVTYLVFLTPISLCYFFLLSWIYKNTKAGFWIVAVILAGITIPGISYFWSTVVGLF